MVTQVDSCFTNSLSYFYFTAFLSSGTFLSICYSVNNEHTTYSTRTLLLSADVEPIPGQTVDTQLILSAVPDVKNEIKSVQIELKGVQTGLKSLMADLSLLKSNVCKLDRRQERLDESKLVTISMNLRVLIDGIY